MKTLIKLALITASMSLIACGDGVHQVGDNNAVAVTVEVQQPIIDIPAEVVYIAIKPYPVAPVLTKPFPIKGDSIVIKPIEEPTEISVETLTNQPD